MENFSYSMTWKETNLSGKQQQVTPLLGSANNCLESITDWRTNLPIFKHKHAILESIANEPVTIVAGDTGSGKTSQVPLYILKGALETSTPCQILSIQPNKLAALSTSKRVSAELGGKFEKFIAHQTEASISSKSQTYHLTFCSKRVFLQSLMNNLNCLLRVTHLVFDQAHERDRFTDILKATLLIHVRTSSLFQNLKLILLSADINTSRLAEYFQVNSIIHIHSQPLVPFSEYFLEDLLMSSDFMEVASSKMVSSNMDLLVSRAWFEGSESAFIEFLKLVGIGKLSVNYQHSKNRISMLMAAALHGKLNFVKNIISYGGDPVMKVKGMTPFDLADNFNHHKVAYFLSSYFPTPPIKKYLLTMKDLSHFYSKQSRRINLEVIMSILGHYISKCSVPGSVLVFLPGCTEVMELYAMISNSLLRHELEVHVFHSYLCVDNYNRVFSPPLSYRRKVILCSAFAETSVAFDDVYCVIDSGVIRDKEIDTVHTDQRKSESISKSSMLERAKHIKSGGIVFRLYSRRRMDGFLAYDIPEINRIPLVDSSLCSFRLKPDKARLQLFYCFFPDGGPPSPMIRESIQVLRELGAIDSKDKVTPLGIRLSHLPIEPSLTKMIFLSMTLKCLDPVLTIACCLARGSPFIEEVSSSISEGLFYSPFPCNSVPLLANDVDDSNIGDHLVLLKAYQLWHNAANETAKNEVCRKHFLSSTSLELIHLLRTQLVHHLKVNGYLDWNETSLVDKFNSNSANWSSVQSVLTAALYPSIARYDPAGGSLATANHAEGESLLHHTSALLLLGNNSNAQKPNSNWHFSLKNGKRCDQGRCYVVFEKGQKAGSFTILRTCSVVPERTVMLFAGNPIIEPLPPNEEKSMDASGNCRLCTEFNFEMLGLESSCRMDSNADLTVNVKLKIDDFIHFVVDAYTAHLIVAIRSKWQNLLLECVNQPGKASSAIEDNWIHSLVRHVSSEECGLVREPWSRQLSQLNLENIGGDNDVLTSSFQKLNCVNLKQSNDSHVYGESAPNGRRITKAVQSNHHLDG